ncbi:MAG: tRNA glutamyl-Q(34) synthetase GluQRS [Phycisphaerales bacterium]
MTRLAPSPTGALHLGNARTFLINWAVARQRGWKVVLRIEDLDGPRIKEGAAEGAIETLRWLGLDWDEGPLIQSRDLAPYVEAMRRLARDGLAFPCALTRAEIEEAASAPHGSTGESRFSRDLRPPIERRSFDDTEMNWRFVVGDGAVEFTDAFAGKQRIAPAESVGDFVIWTKRAQPAYQLAVVVDDHRQGVTDIVRGDDLLDSAARQLMLYRALGLTPEPEYIHLPLVLGEDGRRLAKRHGDTRLDTYRERGVARDRVIGLLACWSGVLDAPKPMSPDAFVSAFNLERLPRNAATFTPENDRWLLA